VPVRVPYPYPHLRTPAQWRVESDFGLDQCAGGLAFLRAGDVSFVPAACRPPRLGKWMTWLRSARQALGPQRHSSSTAIRAHVQAEVDRRQGVRFIDGGGSSLIAPSKVAISADPLPTALSPRWTRRLFYVPNRNPAPPVTAGASRCTGFFSSRLARIDVRYPHLSKPVTCDC